MICKYFGHKKKRVGQVFCQKSKTIACSSFLNVRILCFSLSNMTANVIYIGFSLKNKLLENATLCFWSIYEEHFAIFLFNVRIFCFMW